LAVIVMTVPALNDRRGDIPMLVEHFIESICTEYGVIPKKIDEDAMTSLQNVNWTGNIRELRNVVERLIILSAEKITKKDVMNFVIPSSSESKNQIMQELFDNYNSLDDLLDFVKKEYDAFMTEKV